MAGRYNAQLHGDRQRNPRRAAPNSYPPPPPPPAARPPPSRDPYRERDHGRDYAFRGAADRNSHNRDRAPPRGYDRGQERYPDRPSQEYRPHANDSYHPPAGRIQPPQSDFTFTYDAPGAPGPRFPPAPPSLPARPRSPPRGHDVRRREPPRLGNNNRDPRFGRRDRARPPPRRQPVKPSDRDLLQANRETTPEQLAGMNAEGVSRFRELASDESESKTADREDEAVQHEDGPAKKRSKVDQDSAPVTAPRWSNPDPYTSLPAPDSGAPKKDIVQFIRKAKVDNAADQSVSATAKRSVDFISLDFDDVSAADTYDPEGSPPPPPPHVPIPSAMEVANVGNNKKRSRKRGTDSDRQIGDVADEWISDGTNPTPWYSQPFSFADNVGLLLHMEIVDFYDFVKPTPEDKVVRNDIIESIQHTVQSFRGSSYNSRNVTVHAFGSFAQSLYLPTADMDLVVISNKFRNGGTASFCQTGNQLRRLLAHLTSQGIAKPGTGISITGARVPLVKFTHTQSNIKVDISFENSTGIRAIDTVEAWARQFPEMPILVALVKQFLVMRNLNEVFQGGIGGFTITCLVVHMLSFWPEYQSEQPSLPNYGFMFLEFLDLYGNRFNYYDTGIQMNPMQYFDKERNPTGAKYQMDRLTIIDPNNPQNDVSGGSRNIKSVFEAFKQAHARIQSQLHQLQNGQASSDSLLECILGGNYSSFAQQRARNGELYQALGPHHGHRFSQVPPPPPSYQPVQHENELARPNPPTGSSRKKAKSGKKKKKAKGKNTQKPESQ